MQPLDLVNVGLTGRKLVESSAGTGKTYAITSLYVRLLLERRLSVGQILVVTFTEAATEDLKRRVRARIREAATAFTTGEVKDEFLAGLLRKITEWKEAHRILSDALKTLDEAAIFTIHAFCQRVLQDNAFESASLFEMDFITNQDTLLREIVDDFWRIEFYPASPLFIRHAWQNGLTPESLLLFVKQGLAWPLLQVVPRTEKPDPKIQAALEQNVWKGYKAMAVTWNRSKTEIRDTLLNYEGLHRGIYRQQTVENDLREMEAYLASQNPLGLPSGLERFCSTKLAKSLKGNYGPPRQAFFDQCDAFRNACEALQKSFRQSVLALKGKLVGFVRSELRKRKRQMHVRSFDDLLLDLHEVLSGPGRRVLADSVRKRYLAALIDEFQDTDPLQYTIFQRLFAGDETAVFLIGDPKQAIYSFRGADVFAYMQAARDIGEPLTLDRNWRSTEMLVKAVNCIFESVSTPFVFPDIEFHAVQAGRGNDKFEWEVETSSAPLQLWVMQRTEPDKPINKSRANEELPAAVASEIVRWLQAGASGKARIEGEPLAPHHIAVLVRTNDEARYMQAALLNVGVPSVIHSDESVFKSPEALELQRVFAAIAEPRNEGKVRAALATELLGVTSSELARLAHDEADWDVWLATFAQYRSLWTDEGFMTMAASLITRQQVRRRLLGLPGGARRLTNVLHCVELLHQAALESGLGIEELLKWLAEARQSRMARLEEHQIRLETDEQAVKIVTVHKSKGLQYPVVFCPFCWNTGSRTGEVIFHDVNQSGHLVMDIGSADQDTHERMAEREDLAENARLLYVALTRAEYRCVAVWGAFRDAGGSALAYLLHSPGRLEPANLVQGLKAHFGSLSDENILRDLRRLAGRGQGSIALSAVPEPSLEVYVPPAGQPSGLTCRTLQREIPRGWGIASFSSLIAGKDREAELPDRDSVWERRDEEGEPLPTQVRNRTFLDFPRGRRAGTAVHELFQTLDFSLEPIETARQLVREKLAQFGFEAAWQEPVLQMLRDVLTTPLDPNDAAFTLSSIPELRRLHELEFSFPLDLLTSKRLRAAFAVHRNLEFPTALSEALERLDFMPVRGTMKGFIDLVFERDERFYLVDWKSNFLGNELEGYAYAALRDVMMRELYVLQYHLYAVALDRYLAFRIPDYQYSTHFGGVYYLFLRGMSPQHSAEYGVFRDRPSEALVRELSRCLHVAP